MIRRTVVLGLLLGMVASGVMAQQSVPVMGNWQGEFTTPAWQSRTIHAEIFGTSFTDYTANLFVGSQGGEEKIGQIKGKTQRGITTFEGEIDLGTDLGGIYTVNGQAARGEFNGTFKNGAGEAAFALKRIVIKSPTLGMKPPEGAIVLMEDQGENADQQKALLPKQIATFESQWNIQKRWGVRGDGAVGMSGSSITSKQEFGDALYHIEFRTPYMPNKVDQERGNSGVYLLGRYEVQVLDVFGELKPRDNGCGGIYQLAVPLARACLPPGDWQTYDITFLAPKFDANGKKIRDAEITAKHNGILIHDHLKLPRSTPGGVSGQEAAQGCLLLQDHNDLVNYKNIWVKPLSE